MPQYQNKQLGQDRSWDRTARCFTLFLGTLVFVVMARGNVVLNLRFGKHEMGALMRMGRIAKLSPAENGQQKRKEKRKAAM